MIFWTAFITGLVGSLHCAGMCGPIALALPVGDKIPAMQVMSRVMYNTGRILTYAILGALLGAFGLGLKLAGMQQSISIAAGVIIILITLAGSRKLEVYFQKPYKWLVGDKMSLLFKNKSLFGFLSIGMLNGLLPCGFVYIGLVGSAATQQVWEGALFMALFGLGTAPLMFGVSMMNTILSAELRLKLNRFIPVAAILIGCLFILRGLNLGIPYISPKVSNNQEVVKDCCAPKHK
jgi:sulfite exporter TauE/SafE